MTCSPFNQQLEHLTTLAKSPLRQWQLYAWHRAQELEAEQSGLWSGIADALIGRVRALESESLRQQKRS